MELTQLQGQNPGQKLNLNQVDQVNIGSAPGSQIQNPNLPPQAAQISSNPDGSKTVTAQGNSPVHVNGKPINGSSPVVHGDTLSVGENHNVVMGAHPVGHSISPSQVGQHLGKLNFSPEQISEITHRIFNFKENKEILKPLYILGGVILILLGGLIFAFIQAGGVSSDLLKAKSSLNKEIKEIQSTVSSLQETLGVDLSEDLECDPEIEECDDSEGFSEPLTAVLKDLEKDLSKLKSDQKNLTTEIEKTLETAKNSESQQQAIKLEEFEQKITEIKELLASEKIQIDFSEKYKNKSLAEVILILDDTFGTVISNLNSEIESLSSFKDEVKDEVKEIKEFSLSFDTEKAGTEQKFNTAENKISENEKSIDKLEKKDDSLDTEIKKLEEEINALEVQLKNLK